MHKDIGKMLEYMSGKFLATKMNTNASLLNEKKCHEILSSDLTTLVFSADAAEEKLYSELRVNGSLKRTLKNIDLFNQKIIPSVQPTHATSDMYWLYDRIGKKKS